MRNPNNLLSKNTFSIQKNLKETHVIESAIQISTAIQNLQYIQHTKKFLQYKSTPTKISAALKISAIQISAANKICCIEKILLH